MRNNFITFGNGMRFLNVSVQKEFCVFVRYKMYTCTHYRRSVALRIDRLRVEKF